MDRQPATAGAKADDVPNPLIRSIPTIPAASVPAASSAPSASRMSSVPSGPTHDALAELPDWAQGMIRSFGNVRVRGAVHVHRGVFSQRYLAQLDDGMILVSRSLWTGKRCWLDSDAPPRWRRPDGEPRPRSRPETRPASLHPPPNRSRAPRACLATTRSGAGCRRAATDGDYCAVHRVGK